MVLGGAPNVCPPSEGAEKVLFSPKVARFVLQAQHVNLVKPQNMCPPSRGAENVFIPALYQSFWSHQFGETVLFLALKLTDLFHTPQAVNFSRACEC